MDVLSNLGLGFAVALDKPGGFIGKDAVLAQKASGPLDRRLIQVLLSDPEPLMFHAEIVHRDGVEVGYIRAASYGWTPNRIGCASSRKANRTFRHLLKSGFRPRRRMGPRKLKGPTGGFNVASISRP